MIHSFSLNTRTAFILRHFWTIIESSLLQLLTLLNIKIHFEYNNPYFQPPVPFLLSICVISFPCLQFLSLFFRLRKLRCQLSKPLCTKAVNQEKERKGKVLPGHINCKCICKLKNCPKKMIQIYRNAISSLYCLKKKSECVIKNGMMHKLIKREKWPLHVLMFFQAVVTEIRDLQDCACMITFATMVIKISDPHFCFQSTWDISLLTT